MQQNAPNPTISKSEALALLDQARYRIELETPNRAGPGWQVAPAYAKLLRVIRYYLDPHLEMQEGPDGAEALRDLHGRVVFEEFEDDSSSRAAA